MQTTNGGYQINGLTRQLIRHEGLRLKPYRCPAGKLTIGVGRNIEDRGITEAEAMDSIYSFIRTTMDESSIRSITRRVLAVSVFYFGPYQVGEMIQKIKGARKTKGIRRLQQKMAGVSRHFYF